MNFPASIDQAFALRLTLTLLHFLWQGTLIAAAAFVVTLLWRRASSPARYGVHVAALLLMTLCIPVTYVIVAREVPAMNMSSAVLPPAVAPRDYAAAEAPAPSSQLTETLAPTAVIPDALPVEPQQVSTSPDIGVHGLLAQSAGYVTATYFAGVLVFLVRVMRGMWGSHRLRQRSTLAAESAVLNLLKPPAMRIGLRVLPPLRWCAEVSVPVVIGLVRPIVLLPATAATGLSCDQLQALLAHELAHLRRYDLVANFLQRIIESALFFHPAVWYISRRVSEEREMACDDLVLAAGWEPLRYADALVRMAELSFDSRMRSSVAALTALAATAGTPSEFKRRVHKILGVKPSSELRLNRLSALVLAVAIVSFIAIPATWHHFGAVANAEATHADGDDPAAKEEDMRSPSGGDEPPDDDRLKLLDSAPMIDCRKLIQQLDQANEVRLASQARERLAKRWKSISEQPVASFLRELPRKDPNLEVIERGELIGVQTDLDGVWSNGKGTAENWADWITRKQNDYRVGRLHMLFEAAQGYRRVEDAEGARRALQTGLTGHEIFAADLRALIEKYWPVTNDNPARSLGDGPIAWTLVNYLRELSSAQQALGDLDAAIVTHSRLTLANFMLSWNVPMAAPTKHAIELWSLIRLRPESAVPLFWFNVLDPARPTHSFDLSRAGDKGEPLTYHRYNVCAPPGYDFAELKVTAELRGKTGLLDIYRINAKGLVESLGSLSPVQAGESVQTVTKTLPAPAGVGLVQFLIGGENFRVGKVTVEATLKRSQLAAGGGEGMAHLAADEIRARQELQRLARTEPDHIHATARHTKNRLAWKWSVYLPPGKPWTLYGRVGRIPHLARIDDQTVGYAIQRSDETPIIELEAFINREDGGEWTVWAEADRSILQGTDSAVWSLHTQPEQAEVADYVTGVKKARSTERFNLDVGSVQTMNASDRLRLASIRFIPHEQVGPPAADAALPGFCLWIEPNPKVVPRSANDRAPPGPASEERSPQQTGMKHELLRMLIRGGKIPTDELNAAITLVASQGAGDAEFATSVLAEFDKSCDGGDRTSQAQRSLLAVLTKMFESYGSRRWREQLARFNPDDLPQQIVPTPDATGKLESQMLARVIKHGRSANRSNIDAFVLAVRALHHPEGKPFLLDVVQNPEGNASDPFGPPGAERGPAAGQPGKGKWQDNLGGSWRDAKFHAAVALAELGEAAGVAWLIDHARPNAFGIDDSLFGRSHVRASRGSLRESCHYSLADLFGQQPEATFGELTKWWEVNKNQFTPRPVNLRP